MAENETPITPPPPPVVPRDEYERIKADYERINSEHSKLAEKIKAKELEEAKKRNDWKLIAEQKEREAQEAIAKATNIEQSYLNERKFSALKDEVTRLGLRQEAIEDLSLISLDDVVIEHTSTGKINVLGAKTAAEKIKMMRPHWFSSVQTPNVNSSLPGVISGQKVTYEQLKEAELNAKKTGDYEEYKKLIMKYKAQ